MLENQHQYRIAMHCNPTRLICSMSYHTVFGAKCRTAERAYSDFVKAMTGLPYMVACAELGPVMVRSLLQRRLTRAFRTWHSGR